MLGLGGLSSMVNKPGDGKQIPSIPVQGCAQEGLQFRGPVVVLSVFWRMVDGSDTWDRM